MRTPFRPASSPPRQRALADTGTAAASAPTETYGARPAVDHHAVIGRQLGAAAGDDPIGRLPPPAADKLAGLLAAREDWVAVGRELSERSARAGEARRAAADRLSQAQARRPPDAGTVARAEEEHRRASAESVALGERISRHRSRSTDVAGRIMEWLRALPATATLELHPDPIDAKPSRGESAAEAIERLRAQRLELLADLHEIGSRPVEAAVAVERMRRQIAGLAARGAPNIMSAIEAGTEIFFAVDRRASTPDKPAIDLLGLFCWLHGSALQDRLAAEIQALDDGSGIDDAERHRQEQAVRDHLLALERVEAVLIERADGSVPYRADHNPLAVLGLAAIPEHGR